MQTPFVVGPYRGECLSGVLDVLRDALPADPISRSAFVRKVLLDPNFDPEGARVASLGSEIVGFALALARRFPLEDAPPDMRTGYITLLGVRAEARRSGVGSALLRDAERFLADRGCGDVAISPYAPGYFTPGVDEEACAEGLAWLLRRGYRVVSRPIAMECDLSRIRVDGCAGPDGGEVSIEPHSPERIPALFAFLREYFPGDWQRFARSAIDLIEQGDTPTRVWTAVEGDEVVGFSHHEAERFGPIGVRPDRRGQGIGRALMHKTLASMRLQGLHCAWFMWTDERTAERLYRPAGFRVTRRFSVLRKEVG